MLRINNWSGTRPPDVGSNSSSSPNFAASIVTHMPVDGWVNGYGVYISPHTGEADMFARAAIYFGLNRRHMTGNILTTTNHEWIGTSNNGFMRCAKGTQVNVGWWVPAHRNKRNRFTRTAGEQTRAHPNQSEPPDRIRQSFNQTSRRAGWIFYTPNAEPLRGNWREPTPQGTITTRTPTIAGTMPHPAADRDFDRTSAVGIQVLAASGGLVIGYEFTPTQAELDLGIFRRELLGDALEFDTAYQIRFRHADTWGVYSPWSERRDFDLAGGPSQPALIQPAGKIDVLSGYDYSGTYDHNDGVNADRIEVVLYNAAGTTVISRQTFTRALAPGQIWTIEAWHADLSWGTDYSWSARARDTNGLWGPLAPRVAFRTNRFPLAPTNLTPSGDRTTGSRVFTMSVSDPDGDAITDAQMQLVDVATNTVVAGYPKAMTVSGNTASLTVPAGDLALGRSYRWRGRARDAIGWGPWSAYVAFSFADVPEVELLVPASTPRMNLVADPSAEPTTGGTGGEGESGFWSTLFATENNYIERVSDGNAARGLWMWEAVCSASSTLSMRSEPIPVDLSVPYLLALEMMKVSGVSETTMRVLCYDGAGGFLGARRSESIRRVSADDLTGSWTVYGGVIHPSTANVTNVNRWPAGTETVILEVRPSTNSAAVVRWDAWQFERLFDAGPATAEEAAAGWYGYFDGSTEALGDAGYLWAGEPNDSASIGMARMLQGNSRLRIGYSSPDGTAKAADRTILERYTEGRWSLEAQSGWISGNRAFTFIPGVVANEARYGVTVEVRDANGIVGRSERVEFDTDLPGPPGLPIHFANGDAATGTITVGFQPPTIDQERFEAVEIAVQESTERGDPTGQRRTVAMVRDPQADAATFHFPVSGQHYNVMVRQVENDGARTLQSRWSVANTMVDYYPFAFLKDAIDPTLRAAFVTTRESMPEPELAAAVARYEPWGLDRPTHWPGASRYATGELTMEMFEEEGTDLPPAEDRYRALREMEQRRATLCYMAQVPEPEVRFVALSGPVRVSRNNVMKKTLSLSWEETHFEEPL